ncbi:hypothetical protein FOA43_001661 [Brettanomyces nanus]|uniref:SPS-sensor component PTR3 n=1 Tax=Eeniella nana TaxID=13502 RepID=A0A875S540_EENNA|nr:uncharacterized protein FOA43_001661 [Brettanomyces nanus]QPG74334.1 hypothetical protein FOA43_001661 [Brettanomyces nanus]
MTSLTDVIGQLDRFLSIPSTIDYSQFPPSLVYRICTDCSVLSCGCLISESLARQLSIPKKAFKCPICQSANSHLLKPCQSMRSLSKYLIDLKDGVKLSEPTASSTEQANSITGQPSNRQQNFTFLSAFNEAFTEVNRSNSSSSINGTPQHSFNSREQISTIDSISYKDLGSSQPPLPLPSTSPTSNSTMSSYHSIQRQWTRTSFPSSNLTRLLSGSPKVDKLIPHKKETNKELIFGKNFPFFRKLYQFHIHHSKFFPKSKLFINTGISPSLTRLALLSEKKFEVYSTDPNRPEELPKLLCCGKNDGEYGPNYDVHRRISKEDIVNNSNFANSAATSLDSLSKWEHLSCKVTESMLVIAGTRGFLRILDLTCDGRCLYTYQCKFPIRCIDLSPDESYISLGVTGKDKYTLVEQAFVILLRLEFCDASDLSESTTVTSYNSESTASKAVSTLLHTVSSVTSTSSNDTTATENSERFKRRRILKLTAFPFNLPYRDPITILQFSPNSKLLSVATALESRFLTINIENPSRPALVMKSQRKLDTSLDSEGITDIQFFPDNRIMTLASVAYDTVPIVIDTNITSISGPEGTARPKLLLKVEEVGSTIHKCCVSPRGDSVAYLDRSGTVYIMMCPKMGDTDSKRVVIVTDVANSYTARESASMRFDKPGYKLYVLDRKGLLTIVDFTAGTVEDQSVTRCKIIS